MQLVWTYHSLVRRLGALLPQPQMPPAAGDAALPDEAGWADDDDDDDGAGVDVQMQRRPPPSLIMALCLVPVAAAIAALLSYPRVRALWRAPAPA